MQYLPKLAEALSRLLAILAGCCLVAVVAIVVLNIILRRPPFNAPVLGAHELAAFLGAMVISLALPLNQLRGGNIKVEMMRTFLPERAQVVMERIVLALSGVLTAIIAWRLFVYGAHLRDRAEVSMTLGIPFFPFIFVSGACFVILALVLFIQSIGPASELNK